MTSTAFIFPGQGAQRVGAGLSLYQSCSTARRVFEQANEVLEFDLTRLCFEGPQETLTLTQNAQPVLFTVSAAALAAVREKGIEAAVALGHSLGEYTALFYAEAFDFPTALRLVQKRGKFMGEAAEKAGGTMAAVLGLEDDVVRSIVDEVARGRVLTAANFNTPGQVVVSGEAEAVSDACRAADEAGALRTVPLDVGGAFHSPLMAEAAERMGQELDVTEIRMARVPVIMNATAKPTRDADEIREGLKRQVTTSVRWRESLEKLPELGCSVAVELGSNKLLSGMVRRTVREVAAYAVHDADSLTATVASLKSEKGGECGD